jgi:hypothetical protein
MISLTSNKTLSYYLTKEGYPKFKEWYNSITLLEPIYNELETLTTIINNSTWLEYKLIIDLCKKIKTIITKHIENIFGKHPEIIYNEWINSIQPYCFQGGIGYKIQYSSTPENTIPHHWCVKPEYYNCVVNISDNVILSAIVCDKYINISEQSEKQYWCN